MADRVVVLPEAPDLPYRLGRSIQHDERSKAFRITAPTPLRTVMHRRWGPLLDQDNVGACTYFGLLGALHHRRLYRSGQRYTNAQGFAGYARATEIDPFPGTWRTEAPHGDDTGSSGLAACTVAMELGLITRYDWAFGLDECLRAGVHDTVMLGSGWTESMFDVPSSGIIEVTGEDAGGHLYLMTGIDVSRKLVRIHCAWKGWGVNGQQWAWMRWSDLGARLEDRGDAIVPRRA